MRTKREIIATRISDWRTKTALRNQRRSFAEMCLMAQLSRQRFEDLVRGDEEMAKFTKSWAYRATDLLS